MPRTPSQRSRQSHRSGDGRYSNVNPCYLCEKSAGVDYCSDRRTDTTDSASNEWNDAALCLCDRCASALDKLPDQEAYEYATHAKPAPWLKEKNANV